MQSDVLQAWEKKKRADAAKGDCERGSALGRGGDKNTRVLLDIMTYNTIMYSGMRS